MSKPTSDFQKIPIAAPTFPATTVLYFEKAIYDSFEVKPIEIAAFFNFARFSSPLDCYCPQCGRDSTFHREIQPNEDNPNLADCEVLQLFKCTRQDEHQLIFWFRMRAGTLTKIMQFPSAADLSTGEVKKYKKVLADEAGDFTRAIGLFSHGIGAGALVYLRRIIEKLAEDAHSEARKSPDWNEEAYEKSRFSEKLALLKDRIPPFLTENKILYRILSKGIHELSEEDCKAAFPALKLGIEQILNEKLAAKEKLERDAEASTALQRLNEKLSSEYGD